MNPRLINGIEHISTDEAARWLGRNPQTLRATIYKAALHPVKENGMLWWPLDAVLGFDPRKHDGRYKETKGE